MKENGFGSYPMNRNLLSCSKKKLEQVEHLEQVTYKMLIKMLKLTIIIIVSYI